MFDTLRYNLKHNRKSVMKNTTATLIFGAIILVFVSWGLTPRNQSVAQGGAAAVVNDNTISLAQLSEATERMRRDPRYEQLQSLGGDAGRQFLQQQALSQLVEMELLRQATEKQHIITSDAEVAETIYSIPQFQENGRFKSELYRGYLDAVRKSAAEFEDEIRREDSLRRTFKIFGAALTPIALETTKQKSLSAMKANLDYVSFPVDSVVEPSSVSVADAKAFLAKPENESRVKDYFTSHKADYSTPEQAKVRHILIKSQPGDAESEKNALAKAEDLYKRAQKEDFGKLATQYSDDPGSKASGGVIDYFKHGQMVPEFDKVAFSAPIKEISKPIKTQYGYHLIQVMDRRPAQDKKLEEVNTEIAQKLIAQTQSAAAVASLEGSLQKSDTAAVQKFVNEHKLKWGETGNFSIESENVPKIGPNEEVVRSAFTLSAQKPFHPSIVRQGPTGFVLRYKPATATPAGKEESADVMQEMMASRRSEDSIRQWVDGLRKDAKVSLNAQAGNAQ